jgi:hypothetical protein
MNPAKLRAKIAKSTPENTRVSRPSVTAFERWATQEKLKPFKLYFDAYGRISGRWSIGEDWVRLEIGDGGVAIVTWNRGVTTCILKDLRTSLKFYNLERLVYRPSGA